MKFQYRCWVSALSLALASLLATTAVSRASTILEETGHVAPGNPGGALAAGNAIPAEPSPGDGQYHFSIGGTGAQELDWTPGLTMNNVTVDVSWGVSHNHGWNVSYYFDPTGIGNGGEVLLGTIDQHLLASQDPGSAHTVEGDVAWSGFYTMATGLNLTAASQFRLVDGGLGDSPHVPTSAVWQFTAVPEPSTVVLFGLGAIGLCAVARRRRK